MEAAKPVIGYSDAERALDGTNIDEALPPSKPRASHNIRLLVFGLVLRMASTSEDPEGRGALCRALRRRRDRLLCAQDALFVHVSRRTVVLQHEPVYRRAAA